MAAFTSRKRRRATSALAAACVTVLSAAAVTAPLVHAATDIKNGAPGANGAPGPGPGSPGGNGGPGGGAAASVTSNDSSNVATAAGGRGGEGAAGRPAILPSNQLGGAGGNGGAGGSASATVSSQNPGPTNGASYNATATGGAGGGGGDAGNVGSTNSGAFGNGGAGGTAFAAADILANTSNAIVLMLRAIGGNGGSSVPGSQTPANVPGGIGGNGGVALLGPITAVNSSTARGEVGTMQINATAVAGNGGNGSLVGRGGNGGSVVLDQPLFVDSPGTIFLNQSAYGGTAGIGGPFRAGAGGSAYNSLVLPDPVRGFLTMTANAIGGTGQGGGDAWARVSGTAASRGVFNAHAIGGNGSFDGNNAGSGGDATASAFGVTTGGTELQVSATATGGNGGASGGSPAGAPLLRGGNAVAFAAGTGSAGTLVFGVRGNATGGAAGASFGRPKGASGGDATFSGLASDIGSNRVSLTAELTGGTGGRTTGLAETGGDGGAATLGTLRASSSGGGALTISGSVHGGAGGAGFNGGAGGFAGAVNALSGTTSGSISLTQGAIGGQGGGVTVFGGVAGTPGAGGDALSILTDNDAFAHDLTAQVTANGGRGGSGIGSGTNGSHGAPGGDAFGALDLSGPGNISGFAVITGGVGGANGGNGSMPSIGLVRGISIGSGRVAMSLSASGGAGGGSLSSAPGFGGNGADVSLNNAVIASTAGDAALFQRASGGAAGGGGGSAGAAASTITLADTAARSLAVTTIATGGLGSSAAVGLPGGSGAPARAAADITGQGAVTITTTALGGNGGATSAANPAVSPVAGSGGIARITRARGVSLGGGDVSVTATATGGNGGDGPIGGDGAAVSLLNTVAGSTTSGKLMLTQSVFAGNGGNSNGPMPDGHAGAAGRGGDALSRLTFNDSQSSSIVASVNAAAGSNGSGGASQPFLPRATAQADVTGAHDVSVTASAGNGGTGVAYAGAHAGAGGAATAHAHVQQLSSPFPFSPTSFNATATASTFGGLVQSAVATAQPSAIAGAYDAVASASVGNIVTSTALPTQLQGASLLTAMPAREQLGPALSTAPAVNLTLRGADALELLTIGGAASGDSHPQTLTATANESLDLTQLTSPHQHLVLGLVYGMALNGLPFDSAHFVVTADGGTVIDQTFTTPQAVSDYFTDHLIDLGALDPVPDGRLDLGVRVDVNASSFGGFGAELVFANAAPPAGASDARSAGAALAPEPSVGAAGLLAVAYFATRRRRRRRDGPSCS